MAKAASPVRLQSDLMDAAKITGERQHRSAAEQIEYWANLGRSIAKVVNPDNLLEITSGLAKLQVVPVYAPEVNPDDVFASVERCRNEQLLAAKVSRAPVRYQASTTHLGKLERVSANGDVAVGQFSMGEFIETSE